MELIIVIDRDGECPMYRQIARQLREAVSFGVITAKEQLPTMRKLAKRIHVHPHTVRHAYQVLKREGILLIIQGKGKFVSAVEHGTKTVKVAVSWLKSKIDGFVKEAKREGLHFPEADTLVNALEVLIFPAQE